MPEGGHRASLDSPLPATWLTGLSFPSARLARARGGNPLAPPIPLPVRFRSSTAARMRCRQISYNADNLLTMAREPQPVASVECGDVQTRCRRDSALSQANASSSGRQRLPLRALPLYGREEKYFLTNSIHIIGVSMATNMLNNSLVTAVMTLLIFHAVQSTALAQQPSAAAVDAPLGGCFYGVAPENKIAKGLKNVAVITDPKGAQGYEADDVVFLFERSSFAVANHAQQPYRITGDVPRAIVESGVKTAHLFVTDCHTALHKRSAAVSQPRPR
jgi:hypothetical protein